MHSPAAFSLMSNSVGEFCCVLRRSSISSTGSTISSKFNSQLPRTGAILHAATLLFASNLWSETIFLYGSFNLFYVGFVTVSIRGCGILKKLRVPKPSRNDVA